MRFVAGFIAGCLAISLGFISAPGVVETLHRIALWVLQIK